MSVLSPVLRPPLISLRIQSSVDKFFEQWYLEWGQTLGAGPRKLFPVAHKIGHD